MKRQIGLVVAVLLVLGASNGYAQGPPVKTIDVQVSSGSETGIGFGELDPTKAYKLEVNLKAGMIARSWVIPYTGRGLWDPHNIPDPAPTHSYSAKPVTSDVQYGARFRGFVTAGSLVEPTPFFVDAAFLELSVDSLGRGYVGNGIPVGRDDPASGMQNAQKDLPGGGLVMGVTDPTLTAFPATLTSANWKALRVKFTHHFPGTLTFSVIGTASNSVAIYRVVGGVATKVSSVALALDENINDEIFQIHTIPGFAGSSVQITAQFTFTGPYSSPPNYPSDEVTVSPGGSVLSITAQIPTTPAMTPTRNGTTNPKPSTRAWPSREFQPPGNQTAGAWGSGDAIVLIQGSATSIPLVAARDPSFFSVRWTVQRNTTGDAAGDTADNAALAALGPSTNLTVTPDDPTGQTAHVSLDSMGSFSVICYIDTAGTGVFDPSVDSAKYWNVIVAQVTFDAGSEASLANPAGDAQRAIVNADNTVSSYCGGYGASAIHLEATAKIVCGGADGQLGINRVHVGWCQNELKKSWTGVYLPGPHTTVLYPTDSDDRRRDPIYTSPPLPAALTPALSTGSPLLDAHADLGRGVRPGTGAYTATMGGPQALPTQSPEPASDGIGQERTPTASDSRTTGTYR